MRAAAEVLTLVLALTADMAMAQETGGEEKPARPAAYQWIVLLVLTCLSGMFSGLNLGLMSLTVEDLNIIVMSSEDPQVVKYAQSILPLRRRGNLLLVLYWCQ